MGEPLSEAELFDALVDRLIAEVRRLRAISDPAIDNAGFHYELGRRDERPKFTADLPTEGGWYWWRIRADSGRRIIWVSSSLQAFYPDHMPTSVALLGGEWAGPLVPPA